MFVCICWRWRFVVWFLLWLASLCPALSTSLPPSLIGQLEWFAFFAPLGYSSAVIQHVFVLSYYLAYLFIVHLLLFFSFPHTQTHVHMHTFVVAFFAVLLFSCVAVDVFYASCSSRVCSCCERASEWASQWVCVCLCVCEQSWVCVWLCKCEWTRSMSATTAKQRTQHGPQEQESTTTAAKSISRERPNVLRSYSRLQMQRQLCSLSLK